jgi:hypothetical protein
MVVPHRYSMSHKVFGHKLGGLQAHFGLQALFRQRQAQFWVGTIGCRCQAPSKALSFSVSLCFRTPNRILLQAFDFSSPLPSSWSIQLYPCKSSKSFTIVPSSTSHCRDRCKLKLQKPSSRQVPVARYCRDRSTSPTVAVRSTSLTVASLLSSPFALKTADPPWQMKTLFDTT